jgi:hypothetical protein
MVTRIGLTDGRKLRVWLVRIEILDRIGWLALSWITIAIYRSVC